MNDKNDTTPLLERVREITLKQAGLDDQPDYFTVARSLGVSAAVAERIDETLSTRLCIVNHR
jgi:hypothetical protein